VAIVVDENTRLVVQGLTGSEGRFHGLRNRGYGTNVVAGVTPGKGGQDVEGIAVYDTVAEAVEQAGANTSLIFVPARFAADAAYEAVDAGIGTVIVITEHIPAHEMLRVYTYVRPKGITMIGPNCPGVLSPGKANVGIIPAEVFAEGAIGLVSRSGTLTYQIGYELAQLGLGNSSIVGIGGDPVPGSSFIDILEKFEADSQTEMVDGAEDAGVEVREPRQQQPLLVEVARDEHERQPRQVDHRGHRHRYRHGHQGLDCLPRRRPQGDDHGEDRHRLEDSVQGDVDWVGAGWREQGRRQRQCRPRRQDEPGAPPRRGRRTPERGPATRHRDAEHQPGDYHRGREDL
jgi:succinyl-CoA synthetase alpha subunit